MYFEKIYKVNNNGKHAGIHQCGERKPDGNIHYFVNDKFGDENELKHFPFTETCEHLIPKQQIVSPFSLLETYLNPKYFDVPTNKKQINDKEFIEHCEKSKQIKEAKQNEKILKRQTLIKNTIRQILQKQLDNDEICDQRMINDFKFAVDKEKEIPVDEDIVEHWRTLNDKYLHSEQQN